MADSRSQEAFTGTSATSNKDILFLSDKAAVGKAMYLVFVNTPVPGIVYHILS